ncbi:uncharacterized protein LOC125216792 [Salvia hispanica]|uniref:uncharacterized protein LOC125216792 n=1 Tax=Salvia hispanica TaxID=49212 RepID=UPI0020097BF5|nr:uncharacterized protein LOC125216792 [Salvia hispanica]
MINHGVLESSCTLAFNSDSFPLRRTNICEQGRKAYVVVQWYFIVSLSFQLIMLDNAPGAQNAQLWVNICYPARVSCSNFNRATLIVFRARFFSFSIPYCVYSLLKPL